MDWPGVLRPELVAVAGRAHDKVAEAAVRYGFDGYYTDWRGLVEDERTSVFDNAAADAAHVEPTLAAIAAGKHVVCEKPLARSAADAMRMWEAAEQAKVKHLCCYNYRFVPAVRLARDMLRDGSLGEIYQARFRYSQGWSSLSPDGSLVTIGCHAIDQARFLVGEITSVSALFSDPLSSVGDRADHEAPAPGDIVTALVRFASGAAGTIDASGYCLGRRNMLAWEINCERGALAWDLERLNELRVSAWSDADRSVNGLADVIVCEPGHPFMDMWWPSGHLLGWEHAHTNLFVHFFRCLGEDRAVAPDGATSEDGYRVAVISEAMVASALSGKRVQIEAGPAG
jgi:predicted dehydrogenase